MDPGSNSPDDVHQQNQCLSRYEVTGSQKDESDSPSTKGKRYTTSAESLVSDEKPLLSCETVAVPFCVDGESGSPKAMSEMASVDGKPSRTATLEEPLGVDQEPQSGPSTSETAVEDPVKDPVAAQVSVDTSCTPSRVESPPVEEGASTFTDSNILLKDGEIIHFGLPGDEDQSTATLQMSQIMSTVLSDIQGKDDSWDEEPELRLLRREKVSNAPGPPDYLDIDRSSTGAHCSSHRSASTGDLPQYYSEPLTYDVNGLHINQLPDEVMHHIFSFFAIGELCRLVAQVCRRWCTLVCDPIHWQQLTLGHLPSEQLCYCLERATLLKKLDLGSRDELTLEETILFARNCPQLQELNLAFCDTINNVQLKVISDKCKNLQQINLEGCLHVDDDSLTLLSRLPKLTRVNLSHCSLVQTEGVISLVTGLKRITELNIDGIPSVTDSAIFTLVKHHADHMVKLSVDGAELTDDAVKAFTHFTVLQELRFSFAELLTDVALIHLKKMNQLQALKMKKGSDFSAECLHDLFMAETFSALRFLDLSECVHLLDAGVQAMVKCCGKTLNHLTLCWCWNITDVGLESIVGGCPEMETLQLVGMDKIKGHCLVQIPTAMTKLVLLDLQQCNRVIDDLVVDVVRALPQLVAYNYYGERFQSAAHDGVLMIK